MSKSVFELSRPVQLDSIDRKGWNDKIVAVEAECDALCKRFDLLKMDHLEATIQIVPQQGGIVFHVTGKLQASLSQKSIVSGDAVPVDIQSDIDAWYTDHSRVASFDQAKRDRDQGASDKEDDYEIQTEKDDPEPIYDGVLDVGETAVQFLGLALDDYPRTAKEQEGAGDYIEVKPEDAKPNPFAKLAALKTET